jgi:hypothetical protein
MICSRRVLNIVFPYYGTFKYFGCIVLRSRKKEVDDEMEDWKDELLMSLLECGYGDLERLNEVLKIAEKFDVTIDDVVDYAEQIVDKTLKFNDVIYSGMQLILDKIAENVEDEEIAEKIRNHEVFINYMDSWFNFAVLDDVRKGEIEKTTKEQLVKAVIEEIKEV